MRIFFTFFFAFLFFANEVRSQTLKYLNNDWLVYDEKSKQFYPFVTGNKADLPLHISIDTKLYTGLFLCVKTSQPVSLYVNNRFSRRCNSSIMTAIPVDSIAINQNQPLLLSFYGKYNRSLIDSLAISSKKEIKDEQVYTLDLNLPQVRVGSMARNYFTVLLIACFMLFVLVRNAYTKIFDHYISIFGLLTGNNSEHAQSRVTFDGYNFAFILLGVLFFSLACVSFPIFNNEAVNHTFSDFFGGMFYLMLAAIFFYVLKCLVIFSFSWLFSINKFATSHYMIFVRVSVMWSVTLLLLAMLDYSEVSWVQPILLPSFLFSSLFFLTLTSIKVSLLINRVTKVSTLYLISYLCITEWLPYFVIVKLYMVYFY